MTDAEDSPDIDPFVLDSVYPDPQRLIVHRCPPIEDVKDTALVALDANVLLLPYKFESTSLSAVAGAYKELKDSDRLRVPARAAQEFLKHRSDKLSEIDKIFSDQLSVKRTCLKQINFIENDKDLNEIRRFEKDIHDIEKKIVNRIKKVRQKINSEVGGDPISKVYAECLVDSVVGLQDFDRDEFKKELDYRYKNKIPPGFKDVAKPDQGVGDLLIWKTLLQIGASSKRDLIFVTADSKGDWWSRRGASERVRLELVEEYRAASGGCYFYLQNLSDLLEILGVSNNEVENIRRAEVEYKAPPLDREFEISARILDERRRLKRRIMTLSRKRRDIVSQIEAETNSAEGGYIPSYLYKRLDEVEAELSAFRAAYNGARKYGTEFAEPNMRLPRSWSNAVRETAGLRRCSECGSKRVTVLDDGREYCFDCRQGRAD